MTGEPRPIKVRFDGRYTRIRTVTPDDYPFLYYLATSNENTSSWRFRGTSISYEDFVRRLMDNVLCHFVVESLTQNRLLGYVVAFAPDHRNQHCHLGIVLEPKPSRTVGIEGALLCLNYLFAMFPLRKVYVEIPEYNLVRLRSAQDRLLRLEGVLKDHLYYQDDWWDFLIYGVYPTDVAAYGKRIWNE